jgi:hypothetical protein
MSTVQKVNFEPHRDVMPVVRADYALADPTLADPGNAVALTDGEWMTLNAASRLVRGSVIGTPGDLSLTLTWPLWAERGRTDFQAMADRKMPILWMNPWEFNTRIFDATAALGSGAAITAMFQPLKVATITLGSRNYTGLVGHGGGGDSDIIVGHVTKLPAVNGGKLRLRGGNLY